MKIGDLVRVRVSMLNEPDRWETGAIVIEEYHTWEKMVTIVHKGRLSRMRAHDVQLVSRS